MPIVLLLIAILPLKNHSFWTGSGGVEFTAIKYVGAACVVYAVIYLVMRGPSLHYLDSWQARFYLLFNLLLLISYARTALTLSSMSLLTVASLLMLYFVLLSVVDTIKRLRWVLLTTVASM